MKYAVIDIDETICRVSDDRLKHISGQEKDWDKFYQGTFEDQPIKDNIKLVQSMEGVFKIVYCTSRRRSCFHDTYKWLVDNNLPYGELLMRNSNDWRQCEDVKVHLLNKAGISLEEIAFVMDDNDKVILRFQELGVKCLHVK